MRKSIPVRQVLGIFRANHDTMPELDIITFTNQQSPLREFQNRGEKDDAEPDEEILIEC